MLRAALQNGREDLLQRGDYIEPSYDAGGALAGNMFADLVPSSPTYTAPTYSKTSLPGVINDSGMGNPAYAVAQPYTPAPTYTPVASPVTSGAADWNLYLQNNPDVMANYANVNHSQFPTAASYAQWHYQHYGMTEGRAYPTPVTQPTPPAPVQTPTNGNTGVVPPGTPNSTVPGTTPTTPATPTTPNTTSTNPSVMSLADFIAQTPGYQFQVQQGLNAINSNAYAKGMGQSGATMKALQEYGNNLGQDYYQRYLNNVAQVASGGASAAGALAGVSQNYANNANAVNQNLATVIGQGAIQHGNNTAGMVQGIAGNIQGLVGGLGRTGMFGSSIG